MSVIAMEVQERTCPKTLGICHSIWAKGYALNPAAPTNYWTQHWAGILWPGNFYPMQTLLWANVLELPWVLQIAPQSKVPPTQCSFFFPLLSQVWDLHCRLKSLPTVSCSHSPLSHIDITPNKSILLLTLSWHLLPRGLDCLKELSPFL